MICNGSTVDALTQGIREACRELDSRQEFSGTDARVISFGEEKRIHLSCTDDDFCTLFSNVRRSQFSLKYDELTAHLGGCEFFTLIDADQKPKRTQAEAEAVVEQAAEIANSMES